MVKNFVITAFCLASINFAHACSCVMGKPDFMLFAATEVVFTGKILQIKHNALNVDQATFKIIRSFKGIMAENTITVSYASGTGMCGINGKVGEKYLIFANQRPGGLWTDICIHSGLAKTSGKELSMLRSITRKGNKWYEDGSLAAIGELDKQQFTGDWQFFKKGKLISEGSYVNGLKEGDWKIYSGTKEGKEIITIVKYVKGEHISN